MYDKWGMWVPMRYCENRAHTKTLSGFHRMSFYLLDFYRERLIELKKDKSSNISCGISKPWLACWLTYLHPHSHIVSTPKLSLRAELEL
jgi:hypothetical protein